MPAQSAGMAPVSFGMSHYVPKFCFKTTKVNPDGTIDICCECLPDADLNDDGIVDLIDFWIFARQWLSTRPQP